MFVKWNDQALAAVAWRLRDVPVSKGEYLYHTPASLVGMVYSGVSVTATPHFLFGAASHLIIIIMEICKRPTYQNILTAQGAYTSKNGDNMLQHKIQI